MEDEAVYILLSGVLLHPGRRRPGHVDHRRLSGMWYLPRDLQRASQRAVGLSAWRLRHLVQIRLNDHQAVCASAAALQSHMKRTCMSRGGAWQGQELTSTSAPAAAYRAALPALIPPAAAMMGRPSSRLRTCVVTCAVCSAENFSSCTTSAWTAATSASSTLVTSTTIDRSGACSRNR